MYNENYKKYYINFFYTELCKIIEYYISKNIFV